MTHIMKINEMFVPRKKRKEDTDVIKNILLNGECIGVLGGDFYEGFAVFDRDILKECTGKHDYPVWSDINDEDKLPDINEEIFKKAIQELISEDYYLEDECVYSYSYRTGRGHEESSDLYRVYYIAGDFEE